jgi:hypothetical protein
MTTKNNKLTIEERKEARKTYRREWVRQKRAAEKAGLPSNSTIGTTALIMRVNGTTIMRDTDLAVKLGYDRPTNIRTLINRNLPALETMGTVLQIEASFTSGNGTIKTATEYHLNQAQAVYIISKAGTDEAASMAIVIAEVFALFANGGLVASSAQAEAAVAGVFERYGGRSEAQREHLSARREAFKVLSRRNARAS